MNTASRKSLWFPITSILLVYVAATYLLTGLFGRVSWFDHSDPALSGFLVYVFGFLLAITYGVVLTAHWDFKVPSFRPEKWKPNPRLIVGGMILMIATSIVLNPLMDALPQDYLDRLDSYMEGGFWPMMTAVVAAPILEEFLFRGIIQKNLERRLGPLGGIVVGALIFGLIHLIPQQVVYATVLGMILGSIYYLTGSLTSVIAVHFVNNGLTALLYMFFGSSTNVEKELLGDGLLWWSIYGVSILLLIGWGWYVVRKITGDERNRRVRRIRRIRKNRLSGGNQGN